MTADYTVGTGLQLGGLAFRLTDAENHLLLLALGNSLQVYRKQSGAYTMIATGTMPAMPAIGSTHRLELRTLGATIQGWWDGSLLVQTSDSFQQTATRHGLDWNSAYDPTATFDNFEVRANP